MTTPIYAANGGSATGNGLVPYTPTQTGGGMVMPIATPEQASAAIQAFEGLKGSLATPSDMILMKGGRIFLRKPFWRRVARAFGLNVQLVSEERFVDGSDGSLCYSVIYRAIAPNGAYMDGDGFCSTSELSAPTNTEHNCRARAHTRAKNRAISDLVGGGEVSADELTDDELDEVRRNTSGQSAPRPQQQAQKRTAAPAPAPAPAAKSATWKALSDPDVLEALNRMDIRGREATTAFMSTVKAEMEQMGLAWTRDQVLDHLRTAYATGEVVAADDAHSLDELDTGIPG